MSSPVLLLFRDDNEYPAGLLIDFKGFTYTIFSGKRIVGYCCGFSVSGLNGAFGRRRIIRMERDAIAH